MLIHERAWENQAATLHRIRARVPDLRVFQVSSRDLSLEQAVTSYLFNSQLLETSDGWLLNAPIECADGAARMVVDRLERDGFVDRVRFNDLRQSMDGGGGPACLRLRLPLTEDEFRLLPETLMMTEERVEKLRSWVKKWYPSILRIEDLADAGFARRARKCSQALVEVLGCDRRYCALA